MIQLSKKIAFVIAQNGFRDEEYFIPKTIFQKNGFLVITIAKKKGRAIGAGGGEARVDLSLEEINMRDFSALVFAGGPGAYKYIKERKVIEIIQEADKLKKIIGAICIAPTILARAGVLEGKKATVWSNVLNKKPIKILEEGGAKYLDEAVVVDGRVITANGPQAAKDFALKIIEVIKKYDKN